jgi:hypothetical protein
MAQKKQSDKKIDREIKRYKKEIATKFKEKEKFYKDQLKRIKKIQEKPKLAPARFSQAAWEKKQKASQVKMAKLKPSAAKLFREASQKQSKRAIRDAVKMTKKLAKKVPYVGAAILVHGAVKAISKSTCSKRGGKWVSGKCKGAKKDTRKITSPQVRDPISKR